MIGDRGVYSEIDALRYMNERMHPDLTKKGFVNHVMIEKETGVAVGTCSLHDRDGAEGIDVGYAFRAMHEGKGYASEGAKTMVKLAFEKYRLAYVSAITNDENIGSCRVLENWDLFTQDTQNFQIVPRILNCTF
ncbi:MAG: GNAT family N-acetyltransferase [Ekhidna sp.]